MHDKNLLPKYAEIRTLAEQTLKEHPLQSLLPMEVFDERGNIVQHFSSPEEITYFKILTDYRMYLEAQYLPLINAIILECLKEGKITFNILMGYFKEHSWFGKTLKKKISQDQDIEYNWLNLIAPSLLEYFEQINYSLASGKYPVLVTCIDSLILKIEGLLRDLCNYSGIVTFSQTQDSQGRIVSREKDLTALLHEESQNQQ